MIPYNYNTLKYSFFDNVIGDILRSACGGAKMGSFILSFCCIDYMGMAIDPTKSKNSSNDFKLFISEFLGEVNPIYKDITNELWAIRNSLIHVYGSSDATERMAIGAHFCEDDPQMHLRILRYPDAVQSDLKLWISLPNFIGELIGAVESYFRKNQSNNTQLESWNAKLITLEGANFIDMLAAYKNNRPNHATSHPFLKILDQEPPASVEEISRDICTKLSIK